MFSDFHTAQRNVTCNALEAKLLRSKERPIVLLERTKENHIADNVAPGIHRLGVMLAYTPIHHLLFKYFDSPIVATSANRRDEPIYRSFEQIRDNLADVVDAILDVDRDIVNAIDDSVVQVVEGHVQTIRLGRGYAPLSMPLASKTHQKILALGAQQKSAIALAFEENIILSPHIGDLSSVESFEYFERTIETFKDFYDFKPDLLVCDKHPDYMSSKWAKRQNIELIEVQHHHAHVLACMAEHHLDEKVLAFSFDGTGYGDDGTIWGGEVMVCDYKNFERIGQLAPFRLIGGDKAVKEPRRAALSMLFESYEKEIINECRLPLLSEFTSQEVELLYQAWQKGLNSPHTSSIGRLFDVVASLMGLLHVSLYEARSGLLIEALCHDENAKIFEYEIDDGIIDISPMIRQIVDLVITEKYEEIADRFINTLVAVIDDFIKQYPELPIVFSGGVFQNKTLLSRVLKHSKMQNRHYYIQEKTPINDGAIALGQLAHALHR
jgi:hydrogenase maturation protein HypF